MIDATAVSGMRSGMPLQGRQSLAEFQRGFLDRAMVMSQVDRMNRRNLAKAGAYVRTTAQRSMAYRKKPAPPGKPPSARQGPQGSLIRKLLFFAWDEQYRGVIVGPIMATRRVGSTTIPALHERGGRLPVRSRPARKLGQLGPIRVVGPTPRGKGRGRGSRGKHVRLVKGDAAKRRLVWVRLESHEMIRRAQEIEDEVYGKLGGPYPPRPFMAPAFRKSQMQIRAIWENSLGKGRSR